MTISARVLRAQTSTSADELRALASDTSPQVRRQVAAHALVPADAVATLAADRDWRTRAAVAARADVPAAAAIPLVDDKVWQVRFALASNRHSDPAVWRAIAEATRTDIRMVFVQNSWVPANIAHLMCSDPHKDVRETLANSTPHREVLQRLLTDDHQDVRLAAADPRRVDHDQSGPVGSDPFPDLTDPQVLATWPATPTKPRTTWLKLFPHYRPNQDEVPEHVVWFWRYSVQIDRDPAWIAWWAGSPAKTLIIGVPPAPTRRRHLQQGRDGSVSISAGSPEAFAYIAEPDSLDFREDDPEMLTRVIDLLMPALADALARAAQELGLGTPPPLPPRT